MITKQRFRKSEGGVYVLEVKELVKTFGDFKAVDHVSFTIPDGKF